MYVPCISWHIHSVMYSALFLLLFNNLKYTIMIWKCKKCGSESNENSVTAEWCETCEDMRVKVMPEKREYTSDLIFEKYLDNKCPICDGHVDSDSQRAHTENGGKCMAKYFHCNNCNSEYTVGYERSSMTISSEITHNAVYS